MALKTLVVVCALSVGIRIIRNGKPAEATHAFCKIVWLLGVPCNQVNMAIVTQIRAMCSYKLGPVTPFLIQGNHTSAVGRVESLNFTMIPTSMSPGCHLEHLALFRVHLCLHFGTACNLYGNLHNVIQGSGLTKDPGFVEFTSEWLCLGFGVSACR